MHKDKFQAVTFKNGKIFKVTDATPLESPVVSGLRQMQLAVVNSQKLEVVEQTKSKSYLCRRKIKFFDTPM